jgi:FlaA1/EpsC-like NDP-sugar epimerase
MGTGGDVFVLDMGEPVKVLDLAKKLVRLSGFELKDKENPNGEIEIIFTGLRPGEKLYEELLIGDNVSTTIHNKILRAEEGYLTKSELDRFLELIEKEEKKNNVVGLKKILEEAIPGFIPDQESVDVLYLQQRNEK